MGDLSIIVTMLSHHFKHMAAYHRHATCLIMNSINASCPPVVSEAMTIDAYHQQLPCLFFGSIHGTLNHILGAEELWFHRLAARDNLLPPSIREFVSEECAFAIGSIYSLEGADMRTTWERRVLDRTELEHRLLRQCEAWEELVGLVGESEVEDSILKCSSYLDTTGKPSSVVLASGLTQVFNHGTHHRGQISAALNAINMADTGGSRGCNSLDMQGMGDDFLTYGGVQSVHTTFQNQQKVLREKSI